MTKEQLLIVLNTSLLLQLAGMVYVLISDHYINKRQKNILLINAVCVLTLVIQQNLESYFEEQAMLAARMAASVYGYCIRVVILCMIIQLFSRSKLPWVLVGINTAVYLSAFFTKSVFWIDENNRFQRGPLGYTCLIISLILLVIHAFVSLRNYWRSRHSVNILPLVIEIIIVAGVIADMTSTKNYIIDFLTITIVSGCLFYYIWLHLLFVQEHEEDLKAQQRIKIMVSQIQPHFLYNTLTTIQALCDTDPVTARTTTEKFAAYLRQNLDSLESAELIPFSKELEHTKIYSDIEMIRFDNVNVEFDTPFTDFCVPPLTVQPLVENAIRHGVRIREHGTVDVITRKTDDEYEIIIRDNGKGFDAGVAFVSDSSHIGLRNVRERVEKLCGGSLTISSVIGEGSEVTIHLPLTKQD